MTIKQKADAYDKALREADYWRSLAVISEKLAQGRAGAPGLFAIASQEYENLKAMDPEGFVKKRQEKKSEVIFIIEFIETELKGLKEKLRETF